MKNTEQIKNIIEATSMGRLEKDAVKKCILDLQDVSQQRELLEAYTQFLWTQHNNLTDADNNKLALEKFIASYCV